MVIKTPLQVWIRSHVVLEKRIISPVGPDSAKNMKYIPEIAQIIKLIPITASRMML